MQDKIVIVIQARMSSSRLPGKVMLPVWGKSLLIRMIERVQRTQYPVTIVVATSVDPSDDVIENEAYAHGIPCYRGSLDNLLERHYLAARHHGAHVVLKIPSDCPLIDPAAIDATLDLFYEIPRRYDYVSNLHPATWPDGNDVEVMTMDCLERAYKEAAHSWELEHTTPYIWEHPEHFRIGNLEWGTGLDLSMTHRFTIDYPEDYDFIVQVYKKLYPLRPSFSCNDILQLLEDRPRIYEINAGYAGVNWYRNHLDDLKTISAEQTKVLL
ncbi:cytidylyltransferase domain-containing protein [Taibaiella koreensis]|uniref:cytidylyltransferase domain-containing protein n=1 Tax=Taibaiella koreensis TaxID=1268548 RepID=UPI000E59D5F4|nr:glycosyltransferase family protein [Taibaiella koreensis]